ncbi:hypothetical protein TVAG_078300 [Trichomonas vaginalis G3]|uniref:Glycosyltransferase 61 catalytic domain-containing protein n=1 Tax=Trichomonas vaginalis (strain ATCC PRA-98 / G3) TaxID=412133 RepID=A2FY97_TRIV3|nr:glycosyltransferase family [Trichomonas vaginalis G3]EAX90119.1 hypothetical protein TVAG_078300 [Trichomonas vaginalis G3]KAI5533815.1 glycosyltransferase family [Trichomonas vaginalis G3]|eukprot:XP_001303049.1 hypothetical protein [Trichomonas vaginalis G3]
MIRVTYMDMPLLKPGPIIKGEGDVNIIKVYDFNLSFTPRRTNMIFWFEVINDTFDYNISHPQGTHLFPPHFGEKGMVNFWNNFTSRFTLYRDMYVNNNGAFMNETNVIEPQYRTGPDWLYQFKEGKLATECDTAICFGHYYCKLSFGHFTHDYLFPLMMVPDEVLKDAKIIVPIHVGYIHQYLQLLGYYDKMLELGEEDWIFCKKLLVSTNPRPHNVHFGMGVQKLNIKFREILGIDKIVPTRFVFINRYNSRVIYNLKELFKMTVAKYPQFPWEYLPDQDGSLADYGKLYATIKILVVPNGSNLFKCIYMGKDTLILIINNEMWDLSNYGMMPAAGVRLVVFYNKNYGRLSRGAVIDPSKFMAAMDVTAYYAKHGEFPQPVENVSFIDYKYEQSPRGKVMLVF